VDRAKYALPYTLPKLISSLLNPRLLFSITGWAYLINPNLSVYLMPYPKLVSILRNGLRAIHTKIENLEAKWMSHEIPGAIPYEPPKLSIRASRSFGLKHPPADPKSVVPPSWSSPQTTPKPRAFFPILLPKPKTLSEEPSSLDNTQEDTLFPSDWDTSLSPTRWTPFPNTEPVSATDKLFQNRKIIMLPPAKLTAGKFIMYRTPSKKG
jgi:hypothetical protein